MFKVGDIVRFERDWQKGIGNIVGIYETSYLVNSEDIVKGHDGLISGHLQNNENNYWFGKQHLELVEEELWHDGSGRSGNLFNIEIPKTPNINIPKLAQNLYEGVQREMKLYSVKELHREIKNIYFNEGKRTTVIVFKNGDKVKATASKDTPFSEYAGFVTALFKYEKGLKLKDVEHLIKKKRK